MKVSFKGDYAIKSLVYLSYIYEEEDGRYVQLNELSKSQDIPVKFLEQILLQLKNAGYITSQRGKNGGYILNREPGDIKLGEIIRLIDGPLAPIACVSRSAYKACDFEKQCVLKPIWAEVNIAISNIVDNITFADFAEREKKLKDDIKKEIDYVI